MKPVRLTLQAFGSYADELDIDFVALAQHGVFSITGPTGSGKTTIFDAMVYALYGDIPGKRNVVDIRSHYADDDTETFVRFEFEVKGVRWTIERKPEQTRRKTRGEGTTMALATVLLRESHLVAGGLTKKKDVDQKIEELIGLTCRQFQQVILLPQGEFEAVLKAETRERTEILRRLFPVTIYRDFTERLKVQADALRVQLRETEQARASRLENIRTSFVSIDEQLPADSSRPWDSHQLEADTFAEADIESYLAGAEVAGNALQAKATEEEEKVRELDAQIKDFDRRAAEFENWRKLDEESEAFAEQEADDAKVEESIRIAREIETVAPIIEAYKKDHESLSEINETIAELDRELNSLADSRVVIPEIRTVTNLIDAAAVANSLITSLSAAATERVEIIDLANTLDREKESLRNVEKRQVESRNDITELERELSELREKRDAIKGSLKDIPSKLAQLEKLNADLQRIDAYEALLTKQGDAATEVESATQRLITATNSLELARSAIAANLAAQLALSLVNGEPCLVCGATEHPAPAIEHGLVGDDNLDDVDEAVKLAETELQKARTTFDTVSGQLTAFDSIPNRDVVAAEISPLEKEVENLGNAESEDKQLAEKEAATETSLATIRETLNELNINEAVTRSRVDGVSSELKTRTATFEETFGPLQDFSYNEEQLSNLEKTLRELAEHIDAQKEVRSRVTSAIASLSTLLKKFEVTNVMDLLQLGQSDEEIERSEAMLAAHFKRRSEVRAGISAYIKEGKPQTQPQENLELLEEFETRSAVVRATREAIGAIAQSINRIHESFGLLAVDAAGIEEQRKAVKEYNSLYLLCSGQASANNEVRIALEEWVLSDYLKQVLRQANSRLSKMSGGRFELHVGSMQGDNRGRHGLDLAVLDATTGKFRWARTMSGGETFLAAMSLALGLADVVTSGSNHELGALFIDEGFGTLDPEKLEMVIQVLDSLLDGGRIVGVISHVEEIKQSIPQGITVESTDRGSVATVHRPD